jgi:hypothetical protein
MATKVQDFIKGKAKYDEYGQTVFIEQPDGHQQMFANLRGWGAIQNLFKNKDGSIKFKEAEKFQDMVGEWLQDAINEKLERERQ